ncbi:uncharacterized protein BT62DRAFT_1074952 [Guyanagaster necrorhizus]|uniref:Protein kinase domain-containing protein n=1 Tax=Guyanagaster necrorhizus TaxID=856835 RepID=A0A9P7VU94_9AGAR|nr:uncharacterized protein BT62DRAFT_1074952 [Guyanagaster necrorhizus MCA 3950]KAG7447571.1 hypothetical protein BT62DRAFT_1074952 [Guyanagaster necrorhizus MCA 3950]
MRLFSACLFFITWTLYLCLGGCRPFQLQSRVHQYAIGDKITIKVKPTTLGVRIGIGTPKYKEYECTVIEGRDGVVCRLYTQSQWAVAKYNKPVESDRNALDQAIPFGEEVAALKDVGLYIKTLTAFDGKKWMVMKDVKVGPPRMYHPMKLAVEANTQEECNSVVDAVMERSVEMTEFWIQEKDLYQDDLKSNNCFVTPNLDRLTLIDHGRSRRVTELTQDMKVDIQISSLRGFSALGEKCNEKPKGGQKREFPRLIKPKV